MLKDAALRIESATPNEIDSLLKKDLRYNMMFLMAAIKPARHIDEIEDLFTAKIFGKSEFRAIRNAFLKHGYWELNSLGYVLVKKDHIDLGDLTLHEFTNMTLNLLTHLNDGPSNYENLFVVTNENLKKEFYQAVHKALKHFIKESSTVDGDRLVAWTHIGLDCGSPDKILTRSLHS